MNIVKGNSWKINILYLQKLCPLLWSLLIAIPVQQPCFLEVKGKYQKFILFDFFSPFFKVLSNCYLQHFEELQPNRYFHSSPVLTVHGDASTVRAGYFRVEPFYVDIAANLIFFITVVLIYFVILQLLALSLTTLGVLVKCLALHSGGFRIPFKRLFFLTDSRHVILSGLL